MSVDFSRIIRVTQGVAGKGTDMEKQFELFTTDSREINEQNALFVAFKGEKNDAHDYLGAVLEKGNTGALIEDPAFLTANAATDITNTVVSA